MKQLIPLTSLSELATGEKYLVLIQPDFEIGCVDVTRMFTGDKDEVLEFIPNHYGMVIQQAEENYKEDEYLTMLEDCMEGDGEDFMQIFKL